MRLQRHGGTSMCKVPSTNTWCILLRTGSQVSQEQSSTSSGEGEGEQMTSARENSHSSREENGRSRYVMQGNSSEGTSSTSGSRDAFAGSWDGSCGDGANSSRTCTSTRSSCSSDSDTGAGGFEAICTAEGLFNKPRGCAESFSYLRIKFSASRSYVIS